MVKMKGKIIFPDSSLRYTLSDLIYKYFVQKCHFEKIKLSIEKTFNLR